MNALMPAPDTGVNSSSAGARLEALHSRRVMSFLPPTTSGEQGHRANAIGLGHQNRVDDVDDAVRLHDVGDRDPRAVALGVHHYPAAAALHEAQILTLNG